jgi:phosphinothricin acetyltransferase
MKFRPVAFAAPGTRPQRCIDIGRSKGFAYAGVQYSESCLCGSRYGQFGAADNCNMACTGDGAQTCGGINANSVYAKAPWPSSRPAPGPARQRQAAAAGIEGSRRTMASIRYARESDLARLVAIQNFYILNSHSDFSVAPATVEEKRPWFARFAPTGPHRLLVADDAGEVVGCAYSSRYREHEAFRFTIEVSVFLSPDTHRRGIGSALYARLFDELKGETLHRAVAGIGLPNDASVALHRKFGFVEVGTFDEYAFKNGRFLSSIWLQKKLG